MSDLKDSIDSYEKKKGMIREFMDRGAWKHTFHMKKNEYNDIIWYNEDNLNKIDNQVTEAMEEIDWLTRRALVARQFVAERRRENREYDEESN